MKRLTFNRIYVIESLQDGDELTGKELYENLLKLEEEKLKGSFRAVYAPIANLKDWQDLMSLIHKDCTKNNAFPILHFEIHGNENTYDIERAGLWLHSQELLSFKQFGDDIRLINMVCGCNLFISLSVCWGLLSLFSISAVKPMPFCGALGSFCSIDVNDLKIRFNAFYEELFNSFDLPTAFSRLQDSNPKIPSTYQLIPVDYLYFNVYKRYLKEQCSDEGLRKRTLQIAKQGGIEIDSQETCLRLLEDVKKLEKEHRQKDYEDITAKFFMLDKYPENLDNFDIPLSYKDLLARYDIKKS